MTKLLGMLGLAKKAGRLVVGTKNAIAAVRGGKAKLVIAASDISDATRKRISDKTGTYGVETVYISETTVSLGNALGKTATACAAITDNGFADAVRNILGGN